MAKKRIKLVLIDGNALVHRGFHALPPLTTSKGEMVNGVYGFTTTMLKAFQELKPTHVAVAFDRKGDTFRHKIFKDYKGKREAAPTELYRQFPRVKEIVKAFNIPIYSMKGYEADDFIGTLSKTCNVPNVIVTGDNDALQLVDSNTNVYTLRRGIKDTVLYDTKKVINKYNGLKPDQLVDFKGLAGDASDNIPGVTGIGEKTAITLLNHFGTLENLYKEIKKPGFATKNKKEKLVRPKALENLLEQEEQAFLSKRLGTIITDIRIDFDLTACELKDYDPETVINLFRELEFKQLLAKIPEYKPPTSGQRTLFDKPKETGPFSLKKTCQRNNVAYTHVKGGDNAPAQKLLSSLEKQKLITIDTETTSLHPMEATLLGISFCIRKGEATYLSDISRLSASHKKRLKNILASKTIHKIGHNIKYDFIILENAGFPLSGIKFDTMIAAYLLLPGIRRYNLDDLVFQELSYKMMTYSDLVGTGKNKKALTDVEEEKLAFYAAEDADMTFRLFKLYKKQFIKEKKLEKLFKTIEMPLIYVLASMEMHGIKVNASILKKLSKEFGKNIVGLAKEIYKLAGTSAFNINSTQQLSKILFDTLKLPIQGIKKTQTGYSTASSELQKLHKAHPIIGCIEEYRELTKLKNTYIDTLPDLINPKTGRIHTSFNQTVTATGRLSSSDPNLQNIPVRSHFGTKIRKAFVSDKGKIFISADYSQIDLRVVAHIAQDKEMIKAFRENQDIHTYTASLMFDKKQSNVTPEERDTAKTINFGIIYGMSPYGLATRMGITFDDAREFITRYFERYTGIKDYMNDIVADARLKGYVETLTGRRRNLPELQAQSGPVVSAGERIAINMPVQGTAADIIKIAMRDIFELTKKENLKMAMVLQIHDELVFEADESKVQELQPIIKEKMETAFKLDVPLTVNMGTGKNWGALK
ncbi:DNA polymerase I [Patescibacteria group bacterium]|nr:DNA polymerase I [Patescibacteria group bacterium]